MIHIGTIIRPILARLRESAGPSLVEGIEDAREQEPGADEAGCGDDPAEDGERVPDDHNAHRQPFPRALSIGAGKP